MAQHIHADPHHKERMVPPAFAGLADVAGSSYETTLEHHFGVSEASGSTSLNMHVAYIGAGEESRAHFHLRADGAFYVLEGEATQFLWDQHHGRHARVVRKGDFFWAPRGTAHKDFNHSGDRFGIIAVYNNVGTGPESMKVYVEDPIQPREPGQPHPFLANAETNDGQAVATAANYAGYQATGAHDDPHGKEHMTPWAYSTVAESPSRSKVGVTEALGIGEHLGSTRLAFGLIRLDPGTRTRARFLLRSDSAYFVLDGQATVTYRDQNYGKQDRLLQKGDFAYIPRGTVFNVANHSPAPFEAVLANNNVGTFDEALATYVEDAS